MQKYCRKNDYFKNIFRNFARKNDYFKNIFRNFAV